MSHAFLAIYKFCYIDFYPLPPKDDIMWPQNASSFHKSRNGFSLVVWESCDSCCQPKRREMTSTLKHKGRRYAILLQRIGSILDGIDESREKKCRNFKNDEPSIYITECHDGYVSGQAIILSSLLRLPADWYHIAIANFVSSPLSHLSTMEFDSELLFDLMVMNIRENSASRAATVARAFPSHAMLRYRCRPRAAAGFSILIFFH